MWNCSIRFHFLVSADIHLQIMLFYYKRIPIKLLFHILTVQHIVLYHRLRGPTQFKMLQLKLTGWWTWNQFRHMTRFLHTRITEKCRYSHNYFVIIVCIGDKQIRKRVISVDNVLSQEGKKARWMISAQNHFDNNFGFLKFNLMYHFTIFDVPRINWSLWPYSDVK